MSNNNVKERLMEKTIQQFVHYFLFACSTE